MAYRPVTAQQTSQFLIQQEQNKAGRFFGGFNAQRAAQKVAAGQSKQSEAIEKQAKRAATQSTIGSVWNIASTVAGFINPAVGTAMSVGGNLALGAAAPELNQKAVKAGSELQAEGKKELGGINPNNVSSVAKQNVGRLIAGAGSRQARTDSFVAAKEKEGEALRSASQIASTASAVIGAGQGLAGLGGAGAAGATGYQLQDSWGSHLINPAWIA